jgi:hypothetical protein
LQRGNFARDALLPDVTSFQPPDQRMPGTNQEVARKIAQGYDISKATVEGEGARVSDGAMSMFNLMADADEDYNTRYGSTEGWLEAFRRVKPIPRQPAQINLTQIVTKAGLQTTTDVVDYCLARFLSVPLAADDRQALIDFLNQELGTDRIERAASYLEEPLRLLVHLILSAPEYQLG